MPTRARVPSTDTHSCSDEYFSSSGYSIAPKLTVLARFRRLRRRAALPRSAHGLPDAAGVLLGHLSGAVVGAGLGPHVRRGLFGIRDHEDPPVVPTDLHAVDEHERVLGHALHELSHHRTLAL